MLLFLYKIYLIENYIYYFILIIVRTLRNLFIFLLCQFDIKKQLYKIF